MKRPNTFNTPLIDRMRRNGAAKTSIEGVQYKVIMSTNKPRDERGVVSMMVTIILMLVISLIVLGFSQITRRNQRETLDRQLSTQAYYAAETGINDAISQLPNLDLTNAAYSTSCSALITKLHTLGSSEKLNSDGSVKYSCLLLDPTPRSITYGTIKNQHVAAAPLNLNGNLTSLTIRWKAAANANLDPNRCTTTGSGLPTATAWVSACDYAMLHVDLTKSPGAGANAQQLADSTDSFYLVPRMSGPNVAVTSFTNAASRASYDLTTCDSLTGYCTAKLTFAAAVSGRAYSLRISPIYNDAKEVQITCTDSAATCTFAGAQTLIDSTGKAQDQLSRIQVRLPAQLSDVPAEALQSSGSICKIFPTGPGLGAVSADATGLCSSVAPSQISPTGAPSVGTVPCMVGCNAAPVHNPYPQDTYRYDQTYVNNTTLNGSTIVSCLWDFGNGVTRTDKCRPGDEQLITFALPGDTQQYAQQVECHMAGSVNNCVPTGTTSIFPQGCTYGSEYNKVKRSYNITLTVKFSDGTSKTSPPTHSNLPYCY